METKDTKTQYAHILYRNGRYKTWSPCKIQIPPGMESGLAHKFVSDDLIQQELPFTEIIIIKIK